VVTDSRTLVKSQPELWQMVNHPARIEGWLSALAGCAATVEVTSCEPESRLAVETVGPAEPASAEFVLEKKGWGTNVEISAAREGAEPEQLTGWLQAVLEELSSTEKRPFRGLV
jgi:hypothetical protein